MGRFSLGGDNWVQELVRLVLSDFLSRCRKKLLSELALKEAPTEEAGSSSVIPEADPDATSEGDEDGVPRPKLGAGWVGHGPPMRVYGEKRGTRSIHTGGGLCSPGRWVPSRRQLPYLAGLGKIRPQWLHQLRTMDVNEKGESDQIRILVYKLASQEIDECRFLQSLSRLLEGPCGQC